MNFRVVGCCCFFFSNWTGQWWESNDSLLVFIVGTSILSCILVLLMWSHLRKILDYLRFPPNKKKISHTKKEHFWQQPIGIEWAKMKKKREVYIIRIIKNQQHFVFITNFIYFIGLFMLRNGFLVAICSFLFLLESHFCVSLFTRSFDFVFRVSAADAFV